MAIPIEPFLARPTQHDVELSDPYTCQSLVENDMRIRVIAPVTPRETLAQAHLGYAEYARPDALISGVCLERGPASVESLFEDSLAAPEVVRRAIEAERDGVEAVIIDCMNDPGLEAAREAVSIPVVGAAQSSMLLAGMLAHKFSVVSTAARDVYPTELLARRYGLAGSLASTRWVDIPVLELSASHEALLAALVQESRLAIRQDGAHAIVFGCTGMRGMAGALQDKLHALGLEALVIDPTLAALIWAEMLVDLKLSHSRRTYPELGAQLLAEHRHLSAGAAGETPGRCAVRPKLHVLVPVVRGFRNEDWLARTERDYTCYARPGTSIEAAAIAWGPATIETHYLKAMAVPEMLRLARAAERSGASAVVIDCMSDPSLDAAREAVDIPVVGPAQTSAFLAASLAQRFSILGTRSDMGHKFVSQMEEYGISARLASVQTVGLSVQQVESDPEAMFAGLLLAGERAILQDGAHLLIPGCTGMIGIARRLEAALVERGLCVPVIEPPAAAVKMAEALSDLGLAHSKLTYPTPPHKALAGYKEWEY
jgi:allantoin racemase